MQPTISLQLDSACVQLMLRALDASDRRDVERHVLDELGEVQVGLRSIEPKIKGGDRGVRITAVTWALEAYPSTNRDRLIITRAWQSRPAEAERHREGGFRTTIRFTFSAPTDLGAAAWNFSDLLIQLEAHEAEERDRALLLQRERVFRLWYAFLRAKADLEARRESGVPYVDFKIKDATVTLQTELPAPIEIIGQSRLIRMVSGGHVFCDVVDMNAQEIMVVVTSGDVSRIPRRGRLEV
ncbi:hypothetical protein WDZ92_47690, partial [Nostoc sp. NIES-2111]